MYLIRSAEKNDLKDLYELSQIMTFINLPADKELIEKIIVSSNKSFQEPSEQLEKNKYLFVLEDINQKKVVGASMIHAQHGTKDEPHFSLKVSQENKFSQTLNTGFMHGTLKLFLDTDGPTEIGGLILHPSCRNNPHKLGKQLSFVRFLYMGLNQGFFKKEIHSELMPPFDSEGRSPLWEAIGRRFLNMDYHDADVLARSNKEFILSLYPSEVIYVTLLPVEARDAIGKVGDMTAPVKKMLESIGFDYINEVDPFDGGPHYRANLKDISLVKNINKLKIKKTESLKDGKKYLIELPSETSSFSAIQVNGKKEGDSLFIESNDYIDQITSDFESNVIPMEM